MNKYENALVELLNGLGGNYKFYSTEVKEGIGYKTKYILYIPAEVYKEDGRAIEITEEAYNTLVQLDKDINGKE